MQEYQPWNDSWREQLVYIMVPFGAEVPVEVPSDFAYPIFLGAFEHKLGGDDFWKTVAGAMIYVIGHQPDHEGTQAYVRWINRYDQDIVKELVIDATEQIAQDHLETAVWVLQAAVLLDPQVAEAHLNLGVSYCQLGLSLLKDERKTEAESCLNKAAQYLENAVELDPESKLACYNLDIVYEKMGRRKADSKERGLWQKEDMYRSIREEVKERPQRL